MPVVDPAFLPQNEDTPATLPDPEDLVNPVPAVHPVQAHKTKHNATNQSATLPHLLF